MEGKIPFEQLNSQEANERGNQINGFKEESGKTIIERRKWIEKLSLFVKICGFFFFYNTQQHKNSANTVHWKCQKL